MLDNNLNHSETILIYGLMAFLFLMAMYLLVNRYFITEEKEELTKMEIFEQSLNAAVRLALTIFTNDDGRFKTVSVIYASESDVKDDLDFVINIKNAKVVAYTTNELEFTNEKRQKNKVIKTAFYLLDDANVSYIVIADTLIVKTNSDNIDEDRYEILNRIEDVFVVERQKLSKISKVDFSNLLIINTKTISESAQDMIISNLKSLECPEAPICDLMSFSLTDIDSGREFNTYKFTTKIKD